MSLHDEVEKAIDLGKEVIGTPYGNGWAPGTWPDGPSLYARADKRIHTPQFVRNHEMICSALINWLREMVLDLPACGRSQGDAFPGGTGAIGRHFAHAQGTRDYPPVKDCPRGWLCFSPYLGSKLAKQGHVGIALGNGSLLEARLPTLSADRSEVEASHTIARKGGKPFLRIIPPEVWLRM